MWKISYNYFIVENFSPKCIEVNDCHTSVNMPDKTAPQDVSALTMSLVKYILL